jgi:hypothetical protein
MSSCHLLSSFHLYCSDVLLFIYTSSTSLSQYQASSMGSCRSSRHNTLQYILLHLLIHLSQCSVNIVLFELNYPFQICKYLYPFLLNTFPYIFTVSIYLRNVNITLFKLYFPVQICKYLYPVLLNPTLAFIGWWRPDSL